MTQTQVRFSLVIRRYPSERVISDVCRLIYQSTDPKLIASLSGIPYTVGRSFSHVEATTIAEEMKKLKVSFQFRSAGQENFEISFDPEQDLKNNALVDLSPALKLGNLIPGKLFAKILGMLIAVAALVIALTKIDFSFLSSGPSLKKETSELAAGSENFRALIERIEKDVEFRKSQDLVWTRAETSTKLFDSDAVRTFDKSSALLKYREGSTVSVRPNTLMVIGTEQEGDRSIELQDGTLQARLKPSAQPKKLRIQTQVGTLEMESPKPGEQDSRVETSVSNGQVRVAVSHGSARLQPKQPDQSPVEIKSFQQIEATPSKISAPTRFEPTLHLVSPANGSTVMVDPQSVKALDFAWEDLGPDTEYLWTVSTDSEMKNILLTQKTALPNATVNFLDLGTLYWRVTGTRDGVEYKSTPSRIHVQKHQN